MEIEEEAEDLVRLYETALKRRRRGSVIRLELDADACRRTCAASCSARSASPTTSVFLVDGVLALDDMSQLTSARPARSRIRAL